MTTATMEALKKAGVDTSRAALYTAATEFLRLCNATGTTPLPYLQQVMKDMRWGEVLLPRRDEKRDAGRAGVAREGQTATAIAAPTHRERGATNFAPQGQKIFAPAREQSALDRRMAVVVNTAAAQSVLDTFKLRGKTVGDITIAELREIVRLGLHDAALGNRILAYVANPDPFKRVRDYVSATVLQGMIEGVNSHAA